MLRETQVLIAANGNVALAAETLHMEPDVLVAKLVAENGNEINDALKVAMAMHTLDALTQTKDALLARLDELPPAILAKVFLALIDKSQAIALGQQATNLTQNFNSDNRSVLLSLSEAGDDARATIESRLAGLIANGEA